MAAEDMDSALRAVGQFGRYQSLVFFLLGICLFFTASSGLSYIFTTGTPEYRCRVPGCDDVSTEYHPSWLIYAFPANQGKCMHYQLAPGATGPCNQRHFLKNTVRCNEWIYRDDEHTILNEWNITCEENAWKLNLVGTFNVFGQMVGLPVAGLASDRFGRRKVLIWGVLGSSLLGMAQTLAQSYISFIILEFVHDLIGGSIFYSLIYVLGIEITGPDWRNVAYLLIPLMLSVAEIIFGLFAWWIQEWRLLLQIANGFGFFLLSYLWWLPESPRWLTVNGRLDEAFSILQRIAKFNGMKLSDDEVTKLKITLENLAKDEVNDKPQTNMYCTAVHSRSILFRLLMCCILSVSCNFVYYGLMLQSVLEELTGNKYINFIIGSAVEIPGYLLLYLIVNNWAGRRFSQCASLVMTAVFCFAFTAVPDSFAWLRVTLFLLGKMVASASFSMQVIFAMELFPTELRSSLYGLVLTVGHFGAMLATQVSLLSRVMESLPQLLFSGSALLTGLLVLVLPETRNSHFPDTILEAENIGKENQTAVEMTDFNRYPITS